MIYEPGKKYKTIDKLSKLSAKEPEIINKLIYRTILLVLNTISSNINNI